MVLPKVREVSGNAWSAAARQPASGTFWLACAVTVAAILRLAWLGQNSLWTDEFASLQVALHPLAEIPAAALRGNAFEPPLYFWLLHVVSSLLGTSEAALRGLSAAAGILTVPVAWLLVRDLTGRAGSATIVAFLLATNPLHVWYSQDARPYALMLLFALGSLLCLRVALRTGRRSAFVGYAVLGALSILSHAVGIVVPAIAAVWIALDARRWEVVPKFVAASIGLALLIAPFFMALADSIQPGSTGSPPRSLTGLEVPYTLLTYVAGYSLGPPVREIQNLGWQGATERHLVQTVVAGATLVAALAVIVVARPKAVWHLGVLLILPLAVAVLGSAITSKAYNVRYALPSLIGFVGLAGVAGTELRPAAQRLIIGALLVVSLWASAQWFFLPRYWKDDSRAAVACLSKEVPENATVAVTPRYMQGVVRYYAQRARTSMSVIGVSTVDDLYQYQGRPVALLTTRLHHTGEAAAIVQAFRDGADAAVLEGEAPGYRIYAVVPEANRYGPRLRCGSAQ